MGKKLGNRDAPFRFFLFAIFFVVFHHSPKFVFCVISLFSAQVIEEKEEEEEEEGRKNEKGIRGANVSRNVTMYILLSVITYVTKFSQHMIVGSKRGWSLGNNPAAAKLAGALCCSSPSCKHSLNIPIDVWKAKYLFPCEKLPHCVVSGY
jgi:hypothetical protein